MKSLLSVRATAIFPVILIFVVSIFMVESSSYMDGLYSIGYSGQIGPDYDIREIAVELDIQSGYAPENSGVEFTFEPEQKAVSFSIVLEWVDEIPQQLLQNQPDNFQVIVRSPSGVEMRSPSVSNQVGNPGRLEFTAILDNAEEYGVGELGTWTVIIQAGDCGDQTSLLRTVQDGGNEFSFDVSYEYQESYYEEIWFSWRGAIQTTTGLISILVGLFLLHVSSKKKSLGGMIGGDRFPILVAGLLFFFNGLGLFTDGSSGFIWDRSYYLWTNFLGTPFYAMTYPLLLLFPLYYPRTIHARLDPFKARMLILSAILGIMLLFSITHAINKEWYYWWNGYVEDKENFAWIFLNTLYFAGIITCLVVFTYWYKFRNPGRMEKNALAFIIAGFIFTPLNQWDDFHSGFIYLIIGRNIEAAVATGIALLLIGSGLLLMYKERRLIRREVFLISVILTSWLFFFYLNEYMPFGLQGYTLGFSLIRPICFTIAILQFRMFNINITQRVLLYSSLSLFIGVIFFVIKNGFQQAMPSLGFLSIFLITTLFLPLSAFTNYFSERLAPKLTGLFGLSRDTDADGNLVGEETTQPLFEHFRRLLRPRALLAILFFGFLIEILENALNDAIGYPALLSIIYVGILFSALDYLIESNILEGNEQKEEDPDRAGA